MDHKTLKLLQKELLDNAIKEWKKEKDEKKKQQSDKQSKKYKKKQQHNAKTKDDKKHSKKPFSIWDFLIVEPKKPPKQKRKHLKHNSKRVDERI